MNRKDFILKGSLAAFAISIFPKTSISENTIQKCETTNDILGPFYRPNAPIRKSLIFDSSEGSTIELKGKVFSDDCTSVLKDAQVEIWHCNIHGEYDNESEAFLYRGRWITDKFGNYSFKTKLPGKYLNGKAFRPAHIHFRVSHKDHNELISQLYFKGDPHIEKDPWASEKKAEHRILPISLEDTKGSLTVTFDIHLKKK
ncbi:hypothetical protein GYB22_11390 [bacterium]|nr:hypothetical protein [bacterium]